MKEIKSVLILTLIFLFVSYGWCGGISGEGAKAFTDNFLKTWQSIGEDQRADEALKLEKKRLELQKKQMEIEQQQKNSMTEANPKIYKDITQNNGIAWNQFDRDMKLFYLYGFTTATSHVTLGSYRVTKDYTEKENKQIMKLAERVFFDDNKKEKKKMMFTKIEIQQWGEAMSTLEGDSRNNIIRRYMIPQISIGQIVDGLDILYKDFRNAFILIPDAIHVVKNQINGLSNEDTERILLYLRGGQSDSDILTIKNTDGKILKKLSFP